LKDLIVGSGEESTVNAGPFTVPPNHVRCTEPDVVPGAKTAVSLLPFRVKLSAAVILSATSLTFANSLPLTAIGWPTTREPASSKQPWRPWR
jgi:hypothetical protein